MGVWRRVQLARTFGTEVTAVDVPAKLVMPRDHVIDYTRQDFAELGVRYDIVSQAPFSQVRRALEPPSTFVLIGHDQYTRGIACWATWGRCCR